MPASPAETSERIKAANVRYHDAAAEEYDFKWGIDFGPIGQGQVRAKVSKALGRWPDRPFGEALEIGSGTGYFSLNLLQLGLFERLVATDISAGMLTELGRTAQALGLEVRTRATDAEHLPFEDESFDLVLGHAVLHHLPEPDRAFAEFMRVLRPGGTALFAGEPSRHGDRIAAVPKRAATAVAPLWRALMRAGAAPAGHSDGGEENHRLEGSVDVHAFVPGDLRGFASRAGFEDVRVTGEELVANWFGWANRALEATANPEDVPMAWRQYAFHGYLALQKLDSRLLESRLPAAIFYNLMLSARKPA